MDIFDNLLNQKIIPHKDLIKGDLKKKAKQKVNITINNNLLQNKYKKEYKLNNQNTSKFSDNSNKFMIKSFHKDYALKELIKNINKKKSYSIKLKQDNYNINDIKINSLNVNTYNLSTKQNKNKFNKANNTIDVNRSNYINNIHTKNNHLLLSFDKNINKEKEQIKYFKTLENYSKETINSNNNNYINNIINININLDRKRKKNRKQFNLSLKRTINFFSENLFNNSNNNRKNIKLNFNLRDKNLNNTSSFKSIKSSRDEEFIYHHTISNEMVNNNKVKSKNTFLKLLLKNKAKKENLFTFGGIMKSKEKKRINYLSENNLKSIKKNILFNVKKNNNVGNRIILLNDINPIINFNNKTKKPKKKKNFFIQKKKSNENHQIKNLNLLNAFHIKDKLINFVHSPKEQGIKIILKKPESFSNNINFKPELVKEYNQEILLNLLIDEYIFNKKKKLTLKPEVFINYGFNPMVRSYLIDSLAGLQGAFKFHDKTLFITVKIFDNYISSIIASKENKTKIKEKYLDLIFTACFLISSKSEESFIYHLSDYLSIISDKYSKNDLRDMEYSILKFFNFEAFSPNVLDFFEFFSVFYNIDDSLSKKGRIILYIILSDLYLSQLESSFLAFSVICLLYENNINYDEMFKKLDNIFDNLYKEKNYNDKNENRNNNFNKFMMLIKHLKNKTKIKIIIEKIFNCIQNFEKDRLFNIAKKVDLYNSIS